MSRLANQRTNIMAGCVLLIVLLCYDDPPVMPLTYTSLQHPSNIRSTVGFRQPAVSSTRLSIDDE